MLCKPCKGKKFFIAIQVVYICSVSEEINKSFFTTQIDCAEQILHLQKRDNIKRMKLPFTTKEEKQLIVFIGIQASGKSTFYKNVLASFGYGYVNLDTLHTRHNEQRLLSEYLASSKSFVVDNTNPEIKDRERYIPDAKVLGYEVIGIFFQSIVRDCIARNAVRENSVPTKAIPCTQNRLQLPTYGEGFDKLYFVKITDTGFCISDWEE